MRLILSMTVGLYLCAGYAIVRLPDVMKVGFENKLRGYDKNINDLNITIQKYNDNLEILSEKISSIQPSAFKGKKK